MKRNTSRPNLADLCHSARSVLDDHLLHSQMEDLQEQARRLRMEELFNEIKRQLESLADPAPLAKG